MCVNLKMKSVHMTSHVLLWKLWRMRTEVSGIFPAKFNTVTNVETIISSAECQKRRDTRLGDFYDSRQIPTSANRNCNNLKIEIISTHIARIAVDDSLLKLLQRKFRSQSKRWMQKSLIFQQLTKEIISSC